MVFGKLRRRTDVNDRIELVKLIDAGGKGRGMGRHEDNDLTGQEKRDD
jgi:hypothetical protein